MATIRAPGRRIHTEARRGRHATWLELFFDLVVVAAVANIGILLHDDHSLEGTLRAAGLLAVVWWVWISYSYFADLFDTDGSLDRIAQLTAMLGIAVLAVTVAGGVSDDSSLFALTCAALFVLLASMYAVVGRVDPAAGELCRWYVAGSSLGAALWLLSVAVPSPIRWWVWGAAVVVNALVSGPVAYARMRQPPVQSSHMPERMGLFTIVVLGEAVLAVVRGIDATEWSAETVAAAVAGFVVAGGIWWAYFEAFDEEVIDRALETGRSAQVRSFLYGYGHLLVYAAIVATGVGVELLIDEAAHEAPFPALLGWGSTAVIAGFVVISTGIGVPGDPRLFAVKIAVAAVGIAVVLLEVAAEIGGLALAMAWAVLITAEVAVRPSSTGAPSGFPAAEAAAVADTRGGTIGSSASDRERS